MHATIDVSGTQGRLGTLAKIAARNRIVRPGKFWRRQHRIQSWLCCMALGCILPSIAMAVFLIMHSYQRERASVEASTVGMARALMQAVDRELRVTESALQVLATSPSLKTGDLSRFRARSLELVKTQIFRSVILTDPSGQEILNTLKPIGEMLPQSGIINVIKRVIETGQPVVSDLHLGTVSHQLLISIVVPVLSHDKPVYALTGGLYPSELEEVLSRQHQSAGWVIAILDGTGTIVARSADNPRFVGQKALPDLQRQLVKASEGAMDGVNRDGVPTFISYSRSAVSGWSVVIGIPVADLTSDLRRSLWLSIAVASGLVILGLLWAHTIGRLIRRSIEALKAPALALASARCLAPANFIDVTEVSEVGNALVKTSKLLEQRAVEQATAYAELNRMARHLTKARDKALQANRAKSRFLAGVSHELRTPLSGILGYAQLLHRDGGLSLTQSTRVGAMLNAGRHLLEMITCVLDLSEIEAEHMTLRAVEIDVLAIAEACLDLVRPGAEAKSLTLSLVMAPGTPRKFVVDPVRFRQVLLNLLGNAVKFTGRGVVELRLRVAADGLALRIEVADTGPGISVSDRQRLFQDFERVDTTGTVEGAGLGLALSARLVGLMGGRLGHDDNPGGGSIFWLELSLNTPATSCPGVVPLDHARDVEAMTTGILHVLVVDDSTMNRDIASSFLSANGHTVMCAEGGAEAVTAVAGTDFDVVLMDVRMPEVDGLEATRRIRALGGARAQVPIVALTAQAFTDQVAACREAGMDSHLAKPFDPETLLAAVVQAVKAGHRHGVEVSPISIPTTLAAAKPVNAFIGEDLPVLSHEVLERTATFLKPETVTCHMRSIITLGEAFMRDLRAPDALTNHNKELAEAAHRLVGCAGMFGFERLNIVGRSFERAVQSCDDEAPTIADALCAAIEATREEILALP